MASFSLSHYRRHTYVPESGITTGHFSVFKEVATELNFIILVRRGKAACMHWIERDYPAKPLDISMAKTSERTGKVTCRGPEQIIQAQQAGYYVLQPSGPRRELKAFNPLRTPDEMPLDFPANTPEMNEEGQVIDPLSGMALTGDYDLLGVIDPKATGRALTLVATNGRREAPSGLVYERTNPLATRATQRLNGRMGRRPRIMHGPHDLKFALDENNADGCTAFYPGDTVYFIPTVNDLKEFYDKDLHRTPVNIRDAQGRTI